MVGGVPNLSESRIELKVSYPMPRYGMLTM